MSEESYSASLYALLSDKVRERNAAINTLRNILPLEVKRLEFTSETGQNVLKSFLNWLQAEIRIARKSSSTISQKNTVCSLASVIKELKWIISLLDENFPRIDLSGIVLELIDRLTDVLCSGLAGFTEFIYILNNQILCKVPYLNLLKESKLGARSNRLITVLFENAHSTDTPDYIIKTLAFLAISLPEPLKIEPLTYEMLHESFLRYLSSSNGRNENSFLFSAINSLLLDYFEHSRKFGLKYFGFFIPLMKAKNNLISFSKSIEYFTIVRNDLHDEHVSQLIPLLEKELEESQNIQLFSLDPVLFCKQILNENNSTLQEVTRLMFLKLCLRFDSQIKVPSVHFTLFKLLKTKNCSNLNFTIDNKKIRNSHEWNSLLKFHSFNESASKNLNWYKLWYISRFPKRFEDFIKVEELDDFVGKSLGSELQLDPLIFESLAAFFNFRFKDLWWTGTAESTYQLFLNCTLNHFIESQRIEFSLEFFKCLLSPFKFNWNSKKSDDDTDHSIDDVKALDFSLFFKRLQYLENCLAEDEDNDGCVNNEDKSNTNVSVSYYYYEALKSFSIKLQGILNDDMNSCSDSSQSQNIINRTKNQQQLQDSCINFKFFNFIIGLVRREEEELDLSWLSEMSHNAKSRSTKLLEIINEVKFLFVERVQLDSLLSILIPKYSEIQEARDKHDSFNEFDEFTTRNAYYEVNLITSEVFKQQKQLQSVKGSAEDMNSFLIVNLSKVLFSAYSTNTSKPELIQILNDWKIYTKEVLEINLETEHCDNIVGTCITVADVLREARPFFNFPFKLSSISKSLDPTVVLPNPSVIYKKLTSPEQWIPFIYLALKSEKTSIDLATDWLMLCLQNLKSVDGALRSLIIQNSSSALAYSLLLKWVSESSTLSTFPFKLFTSNPCDFIMKSPHFPVIISKFPSIDTIIKMFHGSDENSSLILQNSNYLVAAGFLEDASAKLSNNRKPIADLSFLKTPAVGSSLKFLPLLTSLLSHGQWYPWSIFATALQSLARTFKLSAATDFSEIFNPVHSILVLRSLIPMIHNVDFLKTLFSNVPILSHHPQLLKLTIKLLKQRKIRFNFKEITVETPINDVVTDSDLVADIDHNVDLVTFIIKYGHSTMFSTLNFSPGLFELLYRLLNLTNVNGTRVFSLDSFPSTSSIRDDLKMLILPLGSRIICFESHQKTAIKRNNNALFNEVYFTKCPLTLLKNLCKYLSNFIESDVLTPLLSDLLESDEEFNDFFLKFILKKLFESLNATKASFTVIPDLIKKLIQGLEHDGADNNITAVLIEVLLLIIEVTPIGPNLVDTYLRRFNFNTKIFKRHQDSNSKTALYFFSLLRESPKMTNSELNLAELSKIFEQTDDQEYLSIVKKRLSKFEQFEIEYPKDLRSELISIDDKSYAWMERRWFDQKDFKPQDLNLKEFDEQSDKLNYLYQLISNGNSTKEIEHGEDALKIIEGCLENKKSFDLKEIIKLSENPSRINFKTVSLLALCSPKLEQVSKHLLADMKSKIHWERGEFEEAIESAKGALSIIPMSLPDETKALLLSRIGEWSAISKSERPSNILSQYLEKAMNLCESSSTFSPNSLAQIHIKVARFVDDQYQQIKESEDFKSRAKLLEESRNALNAARSSASSLSASQDRRQIEIGISTLRSQYDLDMQEYTERSKSLNSFLIKSVQNYIYALSFGVTSENDQMAAVSRLCALWFSNSDFNEINELINNAIGATKQRSLPLHLFLPLIYQLAARASFDRTAAAKLQSPFQNTLLRLLVHLTLNFPFDCIYQLLALKAGNTDDPSSSGTLIAVKKRKLLLENEPTATKTPLSEADLRAAAASLIIDQTRKVSDNLIPIIGAIEGLVDAYIELANAPPPVHALKSSSRIEFGQNLKITQYLYPLPSDSPLRLIPIPTGPVDGDRFAGFIDGYKLLGGINLPKQIEAVSVSGSRHSQLVKGKDDVRQDAVMEQVFLRVNRLLSADAETRRRGLSIRTYRVIPLRPLVGLLEWVSDSIPLANYLSEAHERLRPGDLHPSKCRDLLKTEAERPGSTIQSKLNVLIKDIGQRFRPVLRYFFFEHFSLKDWWNAKQAYTSSMATASIVGWIVGLGDRHGMNILLDKRTGKVVHIDLNMIFEAGRTLRVPERVPFRLTPDCIDGLGPEGIGLEGPFKNHAVAALKVLRRERSLLMMIMEVFKYDPLQKWTGIAKAIEHNKPITALNSSNINSINTSSSTDLITKEADRALMRIKEKLEGREEGVVLSESGHVAFLIQTASDPELLCQMYFGWQAYF